MELERNWRIVTMVKFCEEGEFRNCMTLKGTNKWNMGSENQMDGTTLYGELLIRKAIELERSRWRLRMVKFPHGRQNFVIV
jgi:hypothetical protein